MTTVLLTGFEPFGGDETNSSWETVRRTASGWDRSGHGAASAPGLVTARLPCAFTASARALTDLVGRHRPDLVVCTGQATGRARVAPERIAVNLDDARMPDNVGDQPLERPVVAGGPAGYFTTLPVRAAVAAMRSAGVPAAVSGTAGAFVCNHVFYVLMHLIAASGRDVLGGFVHLPLTNEQAAARTEPSLATDTMARGLDVLIRTSLGRSPR